MGESPTAWVLFDGECGFCDASVRWILRRDRRGRFRFGALQGATDARPRYAQGVAAAALRRNVHRDEFVRAIRVDDGDVVRLEAIVGQESHMISRAAAADALVHVPRGEGALEAGSLVRFLALD